MQTNCPQCAQALRVPDGLTNPLLRCPRCGEHFRLDTSQSLTRFPSPVSDRMPPLPAAPPPAMSPPAMSPPAMSPAEVDRGWQESMKAAPRSPGPLVATAPTSRGGAFRFGWGTFVVFLILVKSGPKLARLFNRPQPAPPAPVQMNDEQRRAVEQLLRDIPRQPQDRLQDRPRPGRFPDRAPAEQPLPKD